MSIDYEQDDHVVTITISPSSAIVATSPSQSWAAMHARQRSTLVVALVASVMAAVIVRARRQPPRRPGRDSRGLWPDV